MTRLDQLYELRAKVDAQIGAEVRRLEVAAADAKARLRRTRGRAPIARCGTDSGYYHHRRILNENACEDCKQAHSAAETLRKKRRQVRREATKRQLRLVKGEGA